MIKDTIVWAIKLNPSIVELRATNGPARVKVSVLKKKIEDQYGYVSTVILKQSYFMNGRLLTLIKTSTANTKLKACFRGKDVVKLKPEIAALVLDPRWRKKYL